MSQGAKPAVQARSRQTRDQLMTALEALLRQKDFDEIGVAEIAAAAGVSPASVYRRYDKKDGFIPALFEFYHERLLSWSQSQSVQAVNARNARKGASLRAVIKENSQLVMTQFNELGHLMRPIYTYARARPDLITTQLASLSKQSAANLELELRRHRGAIKRQNLTQAAKMVIYFYESMFGDYCLFPNSLSLTEKDVSPDEFVNNVTDFIYGYLTTPDS